MSEKPQPDNKSAPDEMDVGIEGDVKGDVKLAGEDIFTVDAGGIVIKDSSNVVINIIQDDDDDDHDRAEKKTSRRPATQPHKTISQDDQTSSLTDRDWENLMRRIQKGKCTPFIGGGVANGFLPLDSDVATQWADEYNYPGKNKSDLPGVAQFLATQYDYIFPREELVEKWYTDLKAPDFSKPDEPHSVFANLPLPIYVTTNYDNFMLEALKKHNKGARQDYCRWNNMLKKHPNQPSAIDGEEPEVTTPVVFHLHGSAELPESLVLTEDDYLNFLVNVSTEKGYLPTRIRRALAGTSLLFVGYELSDWDFRVLYRGLVNSIDASLRRISVTVQLPPHPEDSPEAALQQEYISEYFEDRDMHVYWGTAREFAAELRQRWEKFNNAN